MQLKIPESDIESDDDEDEDEEIIKVMVHPRHKPPILIKKHELIRWSENLARETELSYSGELSLSDGFVGNWKEVKDCISLLQGNEVKVTFDNIKVVTKFAIWFNIDILLEEINSWFKENITVDNFGRMLKTTQALKRLGFLEESMNKKIDLQKIILDFVNDLSKEHLKALLTAEFNEHRDIMMHTLFKTEINHTDVFLSVLAPNINSAKVARLTIDLLNNMVTSDKSEILCLFSNEVQEIIDKIEDTESACTETLKKIHSFQKSIDSIREKAAPHGISLEMLQRTRCWRTYSLEKLTLLRQNPNVKCWHFAEIVLDWICINCPNNCDNVTDNQRQVIIEKEEFDEVSYQLRKMCFEDLNSKSNEAEHSGFSRYKHLIELRFNCCYTSSFNYWYGILRMPTFKQLTAGIFLILFAAILFYIIIYMTVFCERPDSDFQVCLISKRITDLKRVTNILLNLDVYGMIALMTSTVIFMIIVRHPIYYIKTFMLKSRISFAFREEEIFALAKSMSVRLTPFFHNSLIYFPFYQADVQLLNVNGMGKVDVKNALKDTDFGICHTYMIFYDTFFWSKYLPIQYKFFSVFTNTYAEIVKELKYQSNSKCARCFHQECSNTRPRQRTSKNISYYVFGISELKIGTILSS